MKLDLSAPHTVYKLADGTRVPGVTTILGVLDKPFLMAWAADEERAFVAAEAGKLHRALETFPTSEAFEAKLLSELPKTRAHQRKKDSAADLGTVIHARVEAWLKGTTLDPEGIGDLFERAVFGFDRFRTWWDGARLHVVHSEHIMVSEQHRCGGTADVIARDEDGRFVLVDLKSSKASAYWPYPNTFGQVAAYGMLWGDVHPINRTIIVRTGKEQDDPGQQVEVPERRLAAGRDLFRASRDVYDALRSLDRK